ncbi:MAG: hypothetical protein ABIJ57_08355, partial [Pseudomonadota bacterium]
VKDLNMIPSQKITTPEVNSRVPAKNFHIEKKFGSIIGSPQLKVNRRIIVENRCHTSFLPHLWSPLPVARRRKNLLKWFDP